MDGAFAWLVGPEAPAGCAVASTAPCSSALVTTAAAKSQRTSTVSTPRSPKSPEGRNELKADRNRESLENDDSRDNIVM